MRINQTVREFPTRAELDAAVSRSVDGPDVLGVGIDTTHRWVSVHFGTGLGVPGVHDLLVPLVRRGFAPRRGL